eukprot:gene1381-1523_t
MISDEKFFSDCCINETNSPRLVEESGLESSWIIQMFDAPEKFDEEGTVVILKGVDYIIYEIGQTIVDLTEEEADIILYDAYVKRTMTDA